VVTANSELPRYTWRRARSTSSQQVKDFAARWKLVADAERDELRAMTLPQKMAQLEALMASARSLGWATTDPAEVDDVRARWNRLAAIYGG
jgi:hypothetical protein